VEILYTYKKNHVDFKYVYLQKKLWKNKSWGYHCFLNIWNSEDSNAFKSNYLIFKNEIYLLSIEKDMKNIIMVKLWYFCMWQRMMWDNFANLSHSFCQQVQLWKLYN
jgi:hypothetical protein